MDKDKLLTQLMLVTVIGLIFLSLWSLYNAYQSTGYSPTFASTMGTFTLVFITAWYAWSTRKLLGATKKQTEATRASYAPQIDARVSTQGKDFFGIDIANRGQGTARDIEIEIVVYTTPLGDESLGNQYRYIAHHTHSLPPGTALKSTGNSPFRIVPRFFLETSEFTLKEAFERGRASIRDENANDDTAHYLSEYFNNLEDSKMLPTKSGNILELCHSLNQFEDVDDLPIIEIWIRYKDTLSDGDTREERIFKARADVTEDSLRKAIQKRPTTHINSGIRYHIGRFLFTNAPSLPARHWDITPPYEEDIDGRIVEDSKVNK